MPKLSGILPIFIFVLFAVVAYSQSTVASPVQTDNGTGSGNGAAQNTGTISVSVTASPGLVGGFSGGIAGVTGQPFSADVIEETDQYLADGNHIHHESHGRIFRDSEGRSRTETEIGGFVAGSKPFVHIQISDPLQNTFIMLDPQSKIAHVNHFGERSTAANYKASPRTLQAAPAAQSGMTAPAPAGSPARTQTVPDTQAPRIARQHSREDLGTMEIEGFTVKGTRLTTTTPAGEMGNDKPMTSITERWFSEDLKTDLLTKSTTPQSGQRVHRLVNIRSGDPDPLLFQVPVDYTVKDQSPQ